MDQKNRVRGPATGPDDIFYDAAGNMVAIGFTANNQPVYQMGYDALNMQTSFLRRNFSTGAVDEDYRYIYGPGNYRFLVWDGATRAITLRGLDNRPVRTYQVTGFGLGAQWDWQQDSIHGANGVMAAVRSDGNHYHYHPDHLGSPRILTSQSGSYVAEHHYHPYGTEHYRFGPGRPDDTNHKFTGHERDANKVTDYMLGRTYFFPLGRFGSVDPARDGWNLYGYVGANPMGAVDPDGLERAQILLDQDNAAFLNGEITQDELMQRFESRAAGAAAGVLFFVPGPEELLVASATKAVGGFVRGAVGRVGGFFKRFFGKADDVPGGGGGVNASTPIGRRGDPLDVAPGTNSPATINGREFTGHALDRLQGRGIMPSVVEDTIQTGVESAGRDGARVFTTDHLKVVLNPNGSVKTVIPQ